jgi:hypothetical protein
MAHHVWPADTVFTRLELEPQDRSCPQCAGRLRLCDHRHRRLFTLDGPLHLVCKLAHCTNPSCTGPHRTIGPEDELAIALPRWLIGWDVFAWIGHRRFARHWSVPQIRAELVDTHAIALSADTIEDAVRRYQIMVAARQSDPARLAQEYAGVGDVLLSIDGLQPEKGHETLYVVRELRRKRVWFAHSLLSSSAAEVQRLLEQAKLWAQRLGLPVRGWISDKQEAFVSGIAALFPEVPHRYCRNHFLRDLAKPMLEEDSHAKVQMRAKVRGLRDLERQVLAQRADATASASPATAAPPADATTANPADAGEVVLDYCTVVRGILNDDQGGPLQPPGLRMAEALTEVRESLQRNLDTKKGGPRRSD